MQRLNILYISNKPLKWQPLKRLFNYRFFDYTIFEKEDNVMGMYQRVFTLCAFYNPSFILLKFRHKDMINKMEKKALKGYGLVLQLKNGKG